MQKTQDRDGWLDLESLSLLRSGWARGDVLLGASIATAGELLDVLKEATEDGTWLGKVGAWARLSRKWLVDSSTGLPASSNSVRLRAKTGSPSATPRRGAMSAGAGSVSMRVIWDVRPMSVRSVCRDSA